MIAVGNIKKKGAFQMLYKCEVVKKFRSAIVKGINNMETKLI